MQFARDKAPLIHRVLFSIPAASESYLLILERVPVLKVFIIRETRQT